MRGWIYVASVRGDPGRVRIGESAVDPRQGSWRAHGGDLHYDALVDAPHAAAATVHARLRALRTADGLYRCSPEFAIAAIHHALGGPPDGERLYEDADTVVPRPEPARPIARPGERGGSAVSFVTPAAAALVAMGLAAWIALRPPPPGGTQTRDAATLSNAADATPQAPAHPPGEVSAAGDPPTAADCIALESVLARCAARRGQSCAAGTTALAHADRRIIPDMQAAGRTFDAAALENFCRAACRHGYRPARADFMATVCRAP